MEILKNEKLLAVQASLGEQDHNERYNIPKEKIEIMDENMKNITCSDNIKEVDGYKTRKRTNKEYDAIWNIFESQFASDFEKYMGYGISDIKRIGIKEFIDFMDWSSQDDIATYKTDRVKVIPCVNCGSHFTTFQLDLGLCGNCKDKFDLERFGSVCESSEANDKGSSAGLQIMFVYVDEFRNLYAKNKKLKELIKDAIEIDELSGYFTRDILIEKIVGQNEDYFIAQCDAQKKKDEAIPLRIQNRMISIKNILMADINEQEKIKRIKAIF